MIEVSLKDLQRLMTAVVDAGVSAYRKSQENQSDIVKRAEAMRYLEMRGYKPVMIRKWTDAGLLHPQKDGDKNCAVKYSLTEIKSLLASIELKRICNGRIGEDSVEQ